MKIQSGRQWRVTRQNYWGVSGETDFPLYQVEISEGHDGCGPDALGINKVFKRLGEFEFTEDPREAANSACMIYDAWYWKNAIEGMRFRRKFMANIIFSWGLQTRRLLIQMRAMPKQKHRHIRWHHNSGFPVSIEIQYVRGCPGINGVLGDDCTRAEIREWGEKMWAALPRCDRFGCNELLPANPYQVFDLHDEALFCSEYCAELAWEAVFIPDGLDEGDK